MLVVAFFVLVMFGVGDSLFSRFLSGLSSIAQPGGDVITPIVYMLVFALIFGNTLVYNMFKKSIEVPLKQNILSQLGPILYSRLQYSHGKEFAFHELTPLQEAGLLRDYDRIDLEEDSIYFPIDNEGKSFFVNGYELKTSKSQGSGRNRKRVTTNHCYLMRAEFPHSRIPMESDLLIVSDFHDNPLWKREIIPIIF